ncbi:MAG: PKD domain-containing protein [Bacteroidetes bacterium]|nr:PKD domain-containing protein [Bacteroidota bacterium]
MALLCIGQLGRALAQPVASFTATPLQGCEPLKVDFTSTSTGAVSYFWKFGNGNTSTLQNPSAVYNNAGKYSVTLIVKDGSGKSDTSFFPDLITVFKSPVADFSVSRKEICAGDTIKVSDKSIKGDGAIVSWNWDMGDGGTSAEHEPYYPYLRDGIYNITLAIKDTNGCEAFEKYLRIMKVNPLPTISILNSAIQKCKVPVKVDFKSVASGTSSLTYAWTFGDGGTDNVANPSYTYSSTGNHTVNLTVTDAKGCKAVSNKTSLVTILAPVADFDVSQTLLCPKVPVQFTNKSTPRDGTGTYQWTFSNGLNLSAESPSVQLNDPGVYDVSLTYNWDGCSHTVSRKALITVADTPSGKIGPRDTTVCRNGNAQMLYGVTGRNIDQVRWNSVITGAMQLPDSLKYPVSLGTNGSYIIRAMLISKDGCQQPADSARITVRGPLAAILLDSSKGCIPYPVKAEWAGSSAAPLKVFAWKYQTQTGNINPFLFTNSTFGKSSVSLKLVDANGCEDSTNNELVAGLKVDLELTSPQKICRNQKFYIKRKASINSPDSVKFFYYRDKLDSIPFPPPDSLMRILTDTPGTYVKYGLIANSFGCMTKLAENQRPKVRVMGPMIIANVKSDCGKDSLSGLNESKEYTKSWWRYKNAVNSTEFDFNKKLHRKLGETHDLWVVAVNDTTGCADSANFSTTIDNQKAYYDYTYNCATRTVQVTNTYIGLADTLFYWKLTHLPTGNITTLQGRDPSFHLAVPGAYTLLLAPKNPKFACTDPFVRRITAYTKPAGQKPQASITSNTCYPVTLALNDPTYSMWKSARWDVGRFLSLNDSQQHFNFKYTDNESLLKVYLTRTDSNLCYYLDTFSFAVGGVKANIQSQQITDPCLQSKIHVASNITQGTNGRTYTYLWDWGYRTSSKSKDTVVESGIKTTTVTLLVTDDHGCATKDFKTFQIKTGRPAARFSVSDTNASCPPFNVFFADSSVSTTGPIVKWVWNFGDSSYSDKQNPGKIYIYPGKFSISLQVTNADGCKDTAFIPDLVVVNGPKGSYTVDRKEGCTPLKVKLNTATSGKIARMEFDMGDGAVFNARDSLYTYKRAGTYIPRLILTDSFGCRYSPKPKDTILVHVLPVAEFDNQPVCANRIYPLINRSFYAGDKAGKLQWTVNNIAWSTADTAYVRFNNSKHNSVKLKVHTAYGCTDSITKPFVAYNVRPSISTLKQKYCLGEDIKIFNASTADTTLSRTDIWINGNALDPLTLAVPQTGRGIISAYVIVEDVLGCRDTMADSMFLKVGDTLPPPPLRIYRSSVVDDYTTETRFNASDEVDFDHYNVSVWRNSKWEIMASSNYRNDTNLLAHGLNTLRNSYCHLITQRNFCNRSSDSLAVIPHCTIETRAVGDTNCSVVTWSAYSGWNQVQKYRIWRKKKSESTFVLLDSVDGATLRYVDSAIMCHVEYDFKIEGVEKNGWLQNSFSDTAHAKPIDHFVVPPPELWRTTVDTNTFTHTEWIPLGKLKYDIDHYRLWKYDNNTWNVLADSLAPQLRFLNDWNTNVQNQTYTYAVDATDVCNHTSARGNVGRSILLSVSPTSDELYPQLSWTPYIVWKEGVKEYKIERSIEHSPFMEIGRVDAQTLTYTDKTLPTECARDFVYRITALRNPTPLHKDSLQCISVSNYSTFYPEIRFYIPNAFTPNGNQLNEGFHPKGVYFYKYEMKIYNRYGQKVYEGDTCMNAWDGTYNGEKSPDGVYAYAITVWDLKGKVYRFGGTLHLLR